MFRMAQALVFLTLLGSTAFADEPAVAMEQLCGTWTRTEVLLDGTTLSLMKIITPTHFAVFQQGTTRQGAELFQSHGGSCRLDGTTLTEEYEFSSSSVLRKTAAKSRVAFDVQTLTQTWTFPDGTTQTEAWTRRR